MDNNDYPKRSGELYSRSIAEGEPRPSLQELPDDALISILESAVYETDYRLAAGELLAMKGDPRLLTTNPCLLDIPAGSVLLGLPAEDIEEAFQVNRHYGVLREMVELETPQRHVELGAFRMAKYCVTNEEFHQFLVESGAEYCPTSWRNNQYEAIQANHPVFTVPIAAAHHYCAWLSERNKRHFRLPTEAEWEYASTGTEVLKFPWGNEFADDHANTIEARHMRTTPIGMYSRGSSPFGVMDMAGNVEEYTSSVYQSYDGVTLDENNAIKALEGALVVRGGSFARFQDLTRNTSRRAVWDPEKFAIGFRYVEELPHH